MEYISVDEMAKTWGISPRSVRNCCAQGRIADAVLRGKTWMIPDFTRGAWKTAKPVSIGAVDLDKMGYDRKGIRKDAAQMNVMWGQSPK